MAQLGKRRTIMRLCGEDPWRDGVCIIDRLLESAGKAEADIRVVVKDLDALREPQRGLILEHLELYLDGPIENHLWRLALTKAQADQMAADRKDRIWKFFHPAPARPRPRIPRSPDTPLGIWAQAVTAATVLVGAAAYLGHLILQSGRILLMLAYLLAVAGACVGARDTVEWRFRVVRRHAKDRECLGFGTTAERGTFAKRTEHRINYYFAKYLPPEVDRDDWLAETAGIRRSLRDEITAVYGQAGIGVDRIAWLIRYRAKKARDLRSKGELWSYRQELATPGWTKARATLGIIALTSGGCWAATGVVLVEPLPAIIALLLLLVCGWISARAWLHLVLGDF
ncbi:hypothetical protein ABZW11_42570 [Nonomuraea sp. NPDC004580]|uniref:hypothetical protein n=1 Tax=Nonomuraea sp. NPDC004580 TaxID=3154552 RepID=UPI0033B7FAA3